MRNAARIDENQSEIVTVLRDVGASVLILSSVGNGCPDIICGFRGVNYFMEVKDGAKRPSARRLTQQEFIWHETWRGQVEIVESAEDALQVIGAVEEGDVCQS